MTRSTGILGRTMHEEDWKHLGRTVSAAAAPLAKFGYEYDYGDPTELRLEHVAVFGELVQWVAPSQPRHVGRIVVLAQNHPSRAAVRGCGKPATTSPREKQQSTP